MEGWIEAGSVKDFENTDRKTVSGAVVFYDGEKFTACENRCPHMGYPMNKGTVRDGVVTCAWHNWQFDMESGGCYRGACDDLQVYPVKVENEKVYVQKQEPYDHFAMHAGRLVEGMLTSDHYLQAKAIALMLKSGGDAKDVVMVALEQAVRHSQTNHPNFQAVYELQAIGDSYELSENFSNREQVAVLLQGIRMAGGPSGDRLMVTSLPEDAILLDKIKNLLSRYAIDSSQIGIERLLINSYEQHFGLDVEKHIMEIVTEAEFLGVREALVCCSAISYFGTKLDIERFKPAYFAWSVGNRRVEPDIETSLAIQWLKDNREVIADESFLNNSGTVDVNQVQESISGNSFEQSFENLLKLLQEGAGIKSIMDAFSLICARRFSRIPVNNGGLWNTATEGIRYIHALRRMYEKSPGTYNIKALFHMAFYFFKSRWVKFSGEWKGSYGDSESYFADSFAENDVKSAIDAGLTLVDAQSEGWEKEFLSPLLAEDNSTLQLNTISAVLSEIKYQEEWQPYISGLITYACDMKMGQNVTSAAKFGRSYLSSRDN